MGLTLAEMEYLEEGMVMDMITELSNDNASDEYQELATQADFDAF